MPGSIEKIRSLNLLVEKAWSLTEVASMVTSTEPVLVAWSNTTCRCLFELFVCLKHPGAIAEQRKVCCC